MGRFSYKTKNRILRESRETKVAKKRKIKKLNQRDLNKDVLGIKMGLLSKK